MTRLVRGIRSPIDGTIPKVLGRTKPGLGPVEIIDVSTLASHIAATGIVATAGGSGSLTSAADKTVVSNISGSAALPTNNTLTAVFDHDLGNTNGMVATRSAGTWTASFTTLITGLGTVVTGVWNATKVGLAYGGTNADLSATGGTSQVLKQVTAGAAITVGQLAASDLSNGTTGSGAVVLATSPTLSGTVGGDVIWSGTQLFNNSVTIENNNTLHLITGVTDWTPNYGGAFPALNLTNVNSGNQFIGNAQFSADTTPVQLIFGKSRGSITTASALLNNDAILSLRAFGDDGSVNAQIPVLGAIYSISVVGSVSTGVVPMAHVWQTMNTGGVLAERMRLTPAGGLAVGTVTDPGSGVINAKKGLKAGGVVVSPSNNSMKVPGDPTGTTSTAAVVMMGLAGSITPSATTGSGNVLMIISGDCFNATAIADGGIIQIRYGTGTAPVNGDAVTGTRLGQQIKFIQATTADKYPFVVQGIATGLTLGTTYWIDLAVAAITGGTATVENITISAAEI